MTDVKGRTAFITGGGNGIGLGIARRLAQAGAKLALADVDTNGLARAESELQSLTDVKTYELDVRDRDGFAQTAASIESSLGVVTLLFNNAGVAGGASVENITYDYWDWVMGINLSGVINGIQTFLPRMVEYGQGGHIVNTASGAGLVATDAGVLYTTSKFGVVGLSEALNPEMKNYGIGVSVLCPGPVATDIVQRTAASAPRTGGSLSEEQERVSEQRRAEATQFLQQGVSIDSAGEMVLRAVENNCLYIHTDSIVKEMLATRTRAILDAMPD